MKTRLWRAGGLLAWLAMAPGVFAQGSLYPAGAPGPTMKTLDQVEPRIPVGPATTPGDAASMFRITNSGSYYLTGNIYGESNRSGIVIAADHVTLDLCGYTLDGRTNASLDGIRPVGARQNVAIRNGHITGWGGSAVNSFIMAEPEFEVFTGCVIQDITAVGNGAGISAGARSSVLRCVSRSNRGTGISLSNLSGLCEDCVSESNQGDGIACSEGATVVHCKVQNNTGIGINCGNEGHTILGCTVYANAGGGIFACKTLIRDCTLNRNTGYGIKIVFACMIEGCNVTNTDGPGIAGANTAQDGSSRILGNNICDNTVGVSLNNNPGNLIYGNTLRNPTNMDIGTGNSGPVSSNAATAGPWHNIALSSGEGGVR